MALRLVLRPQTKLFSFFDWFIILASYRKSQRMLIHTQRATTYSMCFISPRYRVLLFLVWKLYWCCSSCGSNIGRLLLQRCFAFSFPRTGLTRPLCEPWIFLSVLIPDRHRAIVWLLVPLMKHAVQQVFLSLPQCPSTLSMTSPRLRRRRPMVSQSVRQTVLAVFSSKNSRACWRIIWSSIFSSSLRVTDPTKDFWWPRSGNTMWYCLNGRNHNKHQWKAAVTETEQAKRSTEQEVVTTMLIEALVAATVTLL